MKYRMILLVLYCGALQAQGGTAATQLADIDPTSGGSITSAGSYYLGYPVTGNITITVSDVTIDLNGQVVTGDMVISDSLNNIAVTNGIAQKVTVNSGCNNVDISQLTLGGSDIGIDATGTTNLFISDVLIQNTSGDGCRLTTCEDALISDCTFAGSGGNGFNAQTDSKSVSVLKCTALESTMSGFLIDESDNTTFEECISLLNTVDGYTVQSSGANTSTDISFTQCIADGNMGDGWQIGTDGTNTRILLDDCIAQNNMMNGFNVDSDQIINTQKCIAFNNTINGFLNNGGGASTTFVANYAYNNGTNYSGVPGTPVSPTNGSAQFWRNITDS